ncbi:MAG: phosphoribosylformylglycinamidine cyclo-ligase [Chitinophagales bacterium]|jgi:phosphoribosylformylglycinamidine cyclo-ligase|nr:phosphoribosylformylglycinamidine cyclo-ligase [Chitinophagales bacterium]
MISYKDSGVNKEEGYKTISSIKSMVEGTYSPNVLSELGSFGAFYQLPKYQNPVLVSGTDGVGTKLKIAFETGVYHTVGIDCVAMCVNDILCHGAKPLFFLDYLACGKLEAKVAAQIVSGMVQACKETGLSLIGGETAEMPGFYKEGEYDIAGFCVGVVERDAIINGSKIADGDIIIGLPSSGLHSNGFSLVRKLITDFQIDFEGKKIYETLLTPTRLYVKDVFSLLDKNIDIKGIAHITGGGLIENLPRILPENLGATINRNAVPYQPIFEYLQKLGQISMEEMWGTFNMGVGLCLVCESSQVNGILEILPEAFILGEIALSDQSISWHE